MTATFWEFWYCKFDFTSYCSFRLSNPNGCLYQSLDTFIYSDYHCFAFQVLSTLIVNLVGVVNVNFVSFIVRQLAPTLALNIAFAILLQWPLEKMYRLR